MSRSVHANRLSAHADRTSLRAPGLRRCAVLAVIALVAACGKEAPPSSPPATTPEQTEGLAKSEPMPIKPLPERGHGVLHYAAGVVDVDAFSAPRRPLLEQLAHDAQFTLEGDDGAWPPLTLRLRDTPLELALPRLVGDLEYTAEWKNVNGAHRLTKLHVGAARRPVAADRGTEGALPTGEVSAALDRAIAEMHESARSAAGAAPRTEDAPRIDDSDPEARMRAVLALEPEGDQLKELERILKSDPDPRVRAAATASLENSEEFAAVRSLVDALHDPNPEVVVEVIDSLEFAADSSIVPDLEPLLAHEDAQVRQRAADAIAFFAQ
jgi:HEAT repeat protein